MMIQLLAGLAARKQSDLTVACYAYTGLTVGACEGADLSFTNQETGEAEPAVITAAEEDRWQLGLLLRKTVWQRRQSLASVTVCVFGGGYRHKVCILGLE